jgi:hypothetical protein
LIETILVHRPRRPICWNRLTRIIADRSVGALFFGNYHLMDYELMGGDRARRDHRRDQQALA